MTLYKKWLNESKYLIIKQEHNEIISIIKTNEKIDLTKETGYFGHYNYQKDLHTNYINVKKCHFMNNLLKEAYKFDYYNFNCRCRKDKIKKINDYAAIH